MTNFVAISGKVASDPKPFPGQSGKGPTNVRFANSKRVKGADGDYTYEPQFFNAVVFGDDRAAANAATKGMNVHITGRLQWREWTKDDVRHESVEILADSFLVVEGSASNGDTPKSA